MMHLRKICLALTVLFVASTASWADDDLPPLPQGPLLLTSVTQEMLSPDFWIKRLPDPDKVIMDSEKLKDFNDRIHIWATERRNIFKLGRGVPGIAVRRQIELEFNTLRGRALFDVLGARVPKDLFDNEIKPLVQWENVPDKLDMKWGAAVVQTSVRALPVDMEMLEDVGDVEFDQLQFTQIKLWTPVAVYHSSSDGKWLYVQAPYSRGWVKAKDIAYFPNRQELKKYAKPDNHFLVVTGESVPVYTDKSMRGVDQRPSTGTVIPLADPGVVAFPYGDKEKSAYMVWMPYRQADGKVHLEKAYIDAKDDVSKGFLPYTQRNVIRQAFKLMGQRYGWGGMYNGRDCSGFTQDVFLTVGIDMPRNSKPQSFVGIQIDHFQPFEDLERKKKVLQGCKPAITLLRMSKHMMIYLGEIGEHFYVIHSTWAERISMTSDEKNRINQVVVSDLGLNGKSYVGSLFDRILDVNEVNYE